MNTAFARVLAVDGMAGARGLFEHGLENFGLEIKTVRDGRSAPATVADWQPEAILLDRGLAEMDCLSLVGSLRIRARLRRPRMETRTLVTYADLSIDVTYRKATRAGKPLELSRREFDLLLTLARNPERVFTRSQLLDLVWGIDRDITEATVETYVSYVRRKVDVAGVYPIICTIRGAGYSMRLVKDAAA